jgi:hypothetical protein
MFTKPSVNQIEQAYTGNYQPLAQKVDQDKKQHGGIPYDLRQLLALNDLITNQNAGGIQQALNMPTDMPTVAQNAQQMAQQAIQARMMQQAQQQQRKEGQPMVVPPGVPQPKMQPQGIDSIPTNVGSGYAEGGIIGDVHHFTEGGQSKSWIEEFLYSNLTPAEKRRKEMLETQAEADRTVPTSLNQERERSMAQVTKRDPNITAEVMERVGLATKPQEAPQPVVGGGSTANVKPPAPPAPPRPALFRDTGVMPAGERPAGGLDPYLATPQRNLEKSMNVDPDAVVKGGIDMYSKYVGSPSTVGIDRLQAELERRKAKLEGQEPKPGLGGLMDYLENIANAGGRHWYEAGTKGAMLQKANQKAREEQINALTERGIDLAQKKEDVAYGVKKEGFGVGLKEMQDAVKRKYDSAIALETNALEREKLKQQKEMDLKRIAAMHINPALQIAAALQNAKTPEQTEAIKQGIASVYGNKATGPDAAILRDYETSLAKTTELLGKDMRQYGTKEEKAAYEADKKKAFEKLDERYAKYGITGQGAGAGTATAVPLPPDARTNPNKLVVGTIYQTAQGPGKWNGKGFDPQ